MYVRQTPDGRFPRSVRVPQNYSGNAFRAEDAPPPDAGTSSEPERTEEKDETVESSTTAEMAVSKPLPSPGFRLDVGRLFGRQGRGFGVEELLILGLILLVASGESGDELLLLLLLLLFIE